MRARLLRTLYTLFPFDLSGDCQDPCAMDSIRMSCIINFYGRLDLLAGILYSLSRQTFPKEQYEVVLVEDKGGTDAGKQMAEEFSAYLTVVYAPLDRNFGLMGYSRNFGLTRSRGEIVLFLDDDTIIMQNNFLERLDSLFADNNDADAIIPHGEASFSLTKGRYSYHTPYFMTSRCTAYRRSALVELKGFISSFVGQEDVEFVIRFFMSGKRAIEAPQLEYFHPPLLVPNFRKPKAVGFSFSGLKSRYPFVVWLLVIINCARHAPLYLLPVRRYREMGRFGVGFLAGVIVSLFKKEGFQYN